VIVDSVDKVTDPWGVKVTRYEVKNILPPQSINNAMEKQMRAVEIERVAQATAEGIRKIAAAINDEGGPRP